MITCSFLITPSWSHYYNKWKMRIWGIFEKNTRSVYGYSITKWRSKLDRFTSINYIIMYNEQFTVHFGDKLTRCQKLLILLQDYPHIRDSYDLILERYYATYNDKACPSTLERDIRIIQYDIWIYPPSERVRKARKLAQERFLQHIEKTSIIDTIKKLFNF